MKHFITAVCLAIAIHAATPVHAQFVFSIDPASPANTLPPSPSDILAPGPGVAISEAVLGLGPGLADNLNALSFGLDVIPAALGGSEPVPVMFSVDRLAVGAPGTAVDMQAFPGVEAAGDVFESDFGGGNILHTDEMELGLTPGFFGDDVDALTHFEKLGPVPFFSIDDLSAANGGGGGTLANDIFVGAFGALFASGEVDIGLDPLDDIDALLLNDTYMPGVLNPGRDFAAFSLSAFSPSTFTGGPGIFSPADILVTDFTGVFGLGAPAPSIGLDPFDELNALASNPEPGTIVLVGLGLLCFAVVRRRKAKLLLERTK